MKIKINWGNYVILISIDFQTAYDSIRREQLVKALKEYKINSDIIDVKGKFILVIKP